MKFLYEYRTKDNVRHEGVISAPSRDAAFAALKAQGIRPGSVKEAPGLFNKLFGKGKRWIAIAILATIAVASTTVALLQEGKPLSVIEGTTRRQILGDSAVIEKGVRTSWSDVFKSPGDRFFASYALPGQTPAMTTIDLKSLQDALASNVAIEDGDSLEAIQVKRIVEGIKDELRAYVEDGGTIEKYCRRLVRRQQTEIGYYNRAEKEINTAVKNKMPPAYIESLWEKRNADLRQMGIKLVPMPEKMGIENK